MGFLRAVSALLVFTVSTVTVVADKECVPRNFGEDSVVCVCNATYCDSVDKAAPVPSGQYVLYTSSRDGLRFHKTTGSFSSCKKSYRLLLNVYPCTKYQKINGFGTAFTDSAGINALSLSSGSQLNLMRSYFSSTGIELNMGRVPIAGSDFSTRGYSYDDDGEGFNLTKFSLAHEDYLYKIPLIKWAQDLANKSLKLVAAAWSPPVWMKTNNDFVGQSLLKKKCYQAWADYHIKFLDAYKGNDLKFWAISTGNEPVNGLIPIIPINELGWSAEMLREWTAENLGPTLRASQHSKVKLLANDDQRYLLPWTIEILMKDRRVQKYIDGIAVHWYYDTLLSPLVLNQTHDKFPSKFIISTEASIVKAQNNSPAVILGDWTNGEKYMADIIEDMNHWVTGWIDWNFVLDPDGGPNWNNNNVDAAVIVNATSDEFYKQPTFYALGHFSKFVPEGSQRISIIPNGENGLQTVAFTRPDKGRVIILHNKGDNDMETTIADPNRGHINLTVPKKSFNSLLYW